ncbi:armadillo repeat-containing protein 7-like [Ischnura elegans]|uniref:armadillo repeat-containing protein 7-like n=1 Tax=Ischnura elegans TaxID=197161 RepID=UPI001ED89696|nr:armadillo repeat-containing protein 7-like [Ischnura elegans]XP_046393377.1 armadillo repeat-containing protein 7-like [Ischnura elegans]XP_046393378.1 armadillo repeat-containing protein 7-like [Ischnura elegans]XP_046393380.1 armadillo repeat-containing protein 7-like [Ischnura elegans]
MFSTEEDLIHRTGKNGVPRRPFLQELVNEFQDSDSEEAKEQVLANLANFAYDPINYKFFRELMVIDLFLDQITEGTETLIHFALAGLCNLCLDPENKEYILGCGGVKIVASCLSTKNVETLLNAITTLMYLVTPDSKSEITSPAIVDCMQRLSTSKNPRIKNLAVIFLEDYCSSNLLNPANNAMNTASKPSTSNYNSS